MFKHGPITEAEVALATQKAIEDLKAENNRLREFIKVIKNDCGCNAAGMCNCVWDWDKLKFISDYDREQEALKKARGE